ncbi:MAG: DUF1926 domain-containing protein [Nitrospinae bacterium]|nr:DUF1926 domain-containing protein [Nitrospinota bacterium]
MKPVNLLIGIHNHQPVGNFGHVFEEAHDTCYQPQLKVLAEHHGIRIAIHHSGPLLEWLETHRPKYFDLLGKLVDRGQVEILSGGFYEPILSSIPEGDAVGQIEMMNDYIKRRFGFEPKGMWTAERIWDPYLPRIISSAGLKFTLLDDTHFYYAGLTASDMHGYYVTEKHGASVAVFPIDKTLRYSIPFRLPHETIDHIKRLREQGGVTGVTYGDDGEKFGLWPETYKWVYEERWLHNFYETLEKHQDVVNTSFFSQYLETHKARGRIYLPLASYEEMMEWSLPVEAGLKFERVLHDLAESGKKEEWKPFIRGGLWDNFLSKYDESNRMHKKMIYVSGKVAAAMKGLSGKKKDEARRELYQGQCNCAYWHGLFGGLYLNYLRHAVYHHLINAERIADEALHGDKSWLHVETLDYDTDGAPEIAVENQRISAVIDPDMGGTLLEFDYRPASFALSNTFTRRREAYHEKIKSHAGGSGENADKPVSIHDIVRLKEPGLADALHYDPSPRRIFADHFLSPEVGLEDFMRGLYQPLGDFAGIAYEPEVSKSRSEAEVTLTGNAVITVKGEHVPVTVVKKLSFNSKDAAIDVEYVVKNKGGAALDIIFGVELNLTLLAGDADDRYWVAEGLKSKPRLKDIMSHTGATMAGMRDDWAGFTVYAESKNPFDVWCFPVETVSQSEGGFERTYQGSCLFIHHRMAIKPGGRSGFSFSLKVDGGK